MRYESSFVRTLTYVAVYCYEYVLVQSAAHKNVRCTNRVCDGRLLRNQFENRLRNYMLEIFEPLFINLGPQKVIYELFNYATQARARCSTKTTATHELIKLKLKQFSE